jgi:hypothetical protein
MLRFAFPFLAACSEPPEHHDDTDTPTTDTAPVPSLADEGSISLLLLEPSFVDPQATTVLTGLFVESTLGWLDLATCVSSPVGICYSEVPATLDSYVLADEADPALLGSLVTRNVGEEIEVGPWAAPYQYDELAGVGFYYGSRASGADPFGSVGPTFPGGEWGVPVDLPDLVPFPTPIEVTSHATDELSEWFAGQRVPLRWTPGTEGEVRLLVDAVGAKRLYVLEDDGAYDLDLSELLLADDERVDLVVQRRTDATVDVNGNTLDVEIVSSVVVAGTWSEAGPRTEIVDVPDTCEDAALAAPLEAGNYTGELIGASDDMDPGMAGCTGWSAAGPEAVFPILLLPQDLLEVDYRLVADDASVYLLSECGVPTSCLVGADATGVSGTESFEWLHDSETAETLWLVVDSVIGATDAFQLDIAITSLGGSILHPTCVDAIEAGPAESGSWHGTLAGNTNVLEPECAAPSPSGEGITQVSLDPGGTLVASVETPAGGNPKLYLLYNCGIADSCTMASDVQVGAFETLTYTNTSGFSEYLYLVLDGEMGIGEYFLDLDVQ